MTTAQKIIKYCAIAFAVFLIVSIIGGICGAIASISMLCGDEDVVGEMKSYDVTETVKRLEIDLSGARLTIKTGDRFVVESNHKYLKVETGDSALTIKEDQPAFGFHSEGAQVILTVPEDFTFESVIISAGAGAIKADALLAERLSLDLGAGEVDIETLTATAKASINSGAGELKISGGELADLDLDIGVGEANLKSCLTGDCSIDYGVGELNLTLVGAQEDYCITMDKGLGTAIINGVKMEDDTVYGSGETTVEVDGGVGELKIGFAPAADEKKEDENR